MTPSTFTHILNWYHTADVYVSCLYTVSQLMLHYKPQTSVSPALICNKKRNPGDVTFALRTCSCAWLRYVNSHGGHRQVCEPPALSLRERGHAEAPVQLVPLQRLEAGADPALQPSRGHAACRGGCRCRCRVEDEDGERSCKKHQEPHRHTWVLRLLYS